MGKEFIKKMLRENLFHRIKEAGKPEAEENSVDKQGEESKEDSKKVNTITQKIKNATQGDNKLMKLSQVMDKAGVGNADDAADRSLYGKKISGKPDADGNVRHLTPAEADKMGKIIDNPNAFN